MTAIRLMMIFNGIFNKLALENCIMVSRLYFWMLTLNHTSNFLDTLVSGRSKCDGSFALNSGTWCAPIRQRLVRDPLATDKTRCAIMPT